MLDHHGLRWSVARVVYELKVRAGVQRLRFPLRSWSRHELIDRLKPGVAADAAGYAVYWQQHRPRFFFDPGDRAAYGQMLREILGEAGAHALVDEATQIRQGRFRYFSAQVGELGFPPDWHLNPFTGQSTPPNLHWSRIPTFSETTGDIKFIWEPGRFAAAYTLARAYWLTDDDDHAETFWRLVESWREANPPNHGAHWKCGQETALRLMAWCFALYAFAGATVSTPDRVAMLVGMIAVQAERIAGDHVYAYLQKNNHAISEGVGLWTVGLLFPELKKAAAWRDMGRRILEAEGARQIYDDGAYVQQSVNYHRLMLHDYLWALRLGELAGDALPPTLRDRVRRAGEFLHGLQDPETGGAPNYGANDGALILPLNQCDYQDFRPVLSSISYLFEQTRLYEAGPWDEDLLWLFGPDALGAPRTSRPRTSFGAPEGGYYTLRHDLSWAVIRCAELRDRPSQADMLHLDIWRNGVNVAGDPGTYLYYAPLPWSNALVTTQVHNTVVVDGLDQMDRGPRFLWLSRATGSVRHYNTKSGRLAYFEGEHDGYRRLPEPVTHRRAVLKASSDIWVVVDDLLGKGQHTFTLHWLLDDSPHRVVAEDGQVALDLGTDWYGVWVRCCLPDAAETRFDITRGKEATAPRGWRSRYYGIREPALSARMAVVGSAPCRFVSLFAPAESVSQLDISVSRILYRDQNQQLHLELLAPGAASIVACAEWKGMGADERLTIADNRGSV